MILTLKLLPKIKIIEHTQAIFFHRNPKSFPAKWVVVAHVVFFFMGYYYPFLLEVPLKLDPLLV